MHYVSSDATSFDQLEAGLRSHLTTLRVDAIRVERLYDTTSGGVAKARTHLHTDATRPTILLVRDGGTWMAVLRLERRATDDAEHRHLLPSPHPASFSPLLITCAAPEKPLPRAQADPVCESHPRRTRVTSSMGLDSTDLPEVTSNVATGGTARRVHRPSSPSSHHLTRGAHATSRRATATALTRVLDGVALTPACRRHVPRNGAATVSRWNLTSTYVLKSFDLMHPIVGAAVECSVIRNCKACIRLLGGVSSG